MTRTLNWIDLAVWKSLPKIESNSYRYKTEFYLRFLNGEKEKKWSEKKRESGPMRELLLCFFFLSFWAILLCVMWETLLFFRAVIRNKTNGLLRRKTISSGNIFSDHPQLNFSPMEQNFFGGTSPTRWGGPMYVGRNPNSLFGWVLYRN